MEILGPEFDRLGANLKPPTNVSRPFVRDGLSCQRQVLPEVTFRHKICKQNPQKGARSDPEEAGQGRLSCYHFLLFGGAAFYSRCRRLLLLLRRLVVTPRICPLPLLCRLLHRAVRSWSGNRHGEDRGRFGLTKTSVKMRLMSQKGVWKNARRLPAGAAPLSALGAGCTQVGTWLELGKCRTRLRGGSSSFR